MSINRIPYFDKKGPRVTPQQRLLLDTIRKSHGHLDARALCQRTIERVPRISLGTVSRNSHLFEERGLDKRGPRGDKSGKDSYVTGDIVRQVRKNPPVEVAEGLRGDGARGGRDGVQ